VRGTTWDSFLGDGLYPWAVLFVSLVFLFLKREEVRRPLPGREISSTAYRFLGLALLSLLLAFADLGGLLPPLHSLAFRLLLVPLGFFLVLYGAAGRLPLLLFGLTSFAFFFPPILSRHLEASFTQITLSSTVLFLDLLGVPFQVQGQVLMFHPPGQRALPVLIDSRCSGSASLAVFLPFFALMALDRPRPPRSLVVFLVLGLLGTYFQNLLRVLTVLWLGATFGYPALESAHLYAGYFFFLLWIGLFASLYLRGGGEETARL
jgi:exosortase/archaeosortase family protein